MNEEFVKKIIGLRGNIGKKWLGDLPEIIKHYEEKWGITVFPPFILSYNYVAPAKTADGKAVVLKISFPNNHEFPLETVALKFFDGNGAIRILQEDTKGHALLLERAEPGIRLRDVKNDKELVSFASSVIKKFHKPIIQKNNSLFPVISDWGKAFARYRKTFSKKSGPVPVWMIERAEDIFTQFPKDKKETVLLHGDLHSDNIISSQRGWLVIDPKGVIGEREFELGAFLRNPIYDFPKGTDYKKVSIQRIHQFSEELGFDKERIKDWAFACAVISLVHFLEDEGVFKEIYVENATILNGIRF